MNKSKLSQKFKSRLEIMLYTTIIFSSFSIGYLIVGIIPVFLNRTYFPLVLGLCTLISFIILLGFESFSRAGKDIYEIILTTSIPIILINISTLVIFYFTKTLDVPRKVWLIALAIQFLGILVSQIFITKSKTKKFQEQVIAVISSQEEIQKTITKLNNSSLMKECKKILIKAEDRESVQFELEHKKFDEIVVADDVPMIIKELASRYASKSNKRIYIVPSVYDIVLKNSKLQNLSDMPTLITNDLAIPMELASLKRLMDIIISSMALIVLSPMMLIITVLIKADGGTAFFKQERLTKDMKKFEVIKFRSMILNAEKHSGPVLASEDDQRITKIGKLIRATRIDEIPQFINVLKGDMSIIGPRPEREFFVKQFVEQVPEYKYRMNVKAGITGLAQVTGKYNTTFEDKLRYDLLYISDYSLKMDIKILLKTIKVIFIKESTEGV